MTQAKMPGNNHNVVLGMKNANAPIINAATTILALKEYLKQKELDLHARRAENPRAIDWSNYTLAQKNEGELFPIYLKQLVDLIDEPETAPRRGRKSVPYLAPPPNNNEKVILLL